MMFSRKAILILNNPPIELSRFSVKTVQLIVFLMQISLLNSSQFELLLKSFNAKEMRSIMHPLAIPELSGSSFPFVFSEDISLLLDSGLVSELRVEFPIVFFIFKGLSFGKLFGEKFILLSSVSKKNR